MLNNALLANSLAGAPPNEHQIRLSQALQFPTTNLHTNPTIFRDFPQTVPVVPIAGINRLGIYDILRNGMNADQNILIPSLKTSDRSEALSSGDRTPLVRPFKKAPTIESEKIADGFINEEDRTIEVTDLFSSPSFTIPDDAASSVTPVTEWQTEKPENTFIPLPHKKPEIKTEGSTQRSNNIYNLLKTLNMTEDETNGIVSYVEKVVREELARKLLEVRKRSGGGNQTTSSNVTQASNTSSTSADQATHITTTNDEAEKIDDHRVVIPLGHSTPKKDILLYLPRKNTESEIKHHPQRTSDKNLENRTNFIEAEILTAQLHLPIEEKLADERNYDDLQLPIEEGLPLDLNEQPINHENKISTTLRTTIQTVTPRSSSFTPTQKQLLRIRDVTKNTKFVTKSYSTRGNGFVSMKFVTGAPLDLENEDINEINYQTKNSPRTASSIGTTTLTPQLPTVGKPKTTTHPKTPFERLVVDYKQRLAGAVDIDKILKSIYSNAYIALIDAKDAPKVQIPLNVRRAGVTTSG
ncbi:hypothetical protein DICVIV_07438 [Dictyocaulus viviparus]|uniref:Uncharacterized protein n=1 Tax=Dictyocaulus viviparus TaxID=29172 RepID=A0A0D8XRV8_DICVI|nr:hypothetical protein DICVIV_07438 [Dictyocaulus viviparus]